MLRDTPKTYAAAIAVGTVWSAVLIFARRLGALDAVYCLCASVMLALIGDIDRRRHIIPNMSLLILFALRAAYLIIKAIGGEPFGTAAADSFAGAVAVVLMCMVSWLLFRMLGHGDAVGMGDYKYLAVIGWSVGAARIVFVLLSALAAAAVYAAVKRIIFKEGSTTDRTALAPFLSLGAMLWLM